MIATSRTTAGPMDPGALHPWTDPAPTLPDGRPQHRVAVLALEGVVAFEVGAPPPVPDHGAHPAGMAG